ncbi:hypothetical protein [Pseudomonas gingeri]
MTTKQTIDGVPREAVAALKKARDVLRAIIIDKAAGVHYASAQAACHQINHALELRALLDAPAPRAEFKKVEMAHVMSALEDVRGKPVLTSNQCHDLAQALNDRLLSPLQLLAMPAEYLAAAQPQGEPVYQTRWNSLGEWEEWKTVSLEDYKRREGRLFERRIVYAEQPAPVAVVLPERDYSVFPDEFSQGSKSGWNSCLDEVTRLNTK